MNDASLLDRYTGLTQWLVWLAGLMCVCGVMLISYVMGFIDIGMYLIIGSLGLLLLVKGYQDAAFLDNETRLAHQQIAILERVEDFDAFLAEAPQSVFREHIDNLYIISRFHNEVSQDNLIDILHERLRAGNQVTELFAGILVTLGLIGTILGLIIMMGSLADIMAAQSGDALLSALANPESGPLSGLGVAFYTTLIGAIMGGVILRVLTNVVDANIRRYVALLAELSEVYVLPYLRRHGGSDPRAQTDENA